MIVRKIMTYESHRLTAENLVDYKTWPEWLQDYMFYRAREFDIDIRASEGECHLVLPRSKKLMSVGDWIVLRRVGHSCWPNVLPPEVFERDFEEVV